MTRSSRSSFVLISVLAVMGSALLIAMSLLMLAQSHTAAMSGSAARAQSRALAWSGIQAVMADLDRQRDRILDGEIPEVDDQLVIYETDDRAGVVRLLPVGPGDERLVPEAARLDLNSVDADALVATGLVDETQAASIVAHRDGAAGGMFDSVAALLRVEGITPETLYGPLEDLSTAADVAGEEGDLAERVLERLEGAQPRGLADLVTVYAFEPALQRSGRRRISLNVAWSQELADRLDDRFGAGAGSLVKAIIDSGTRFTEEAVIFDAMVQGRTSLEDWANVTDALTTDNGDFHFGRLDINSASAGALEAIGLEPEQAEQIVRTRDGLSLEDRATIVWPILQEILTREQYVEVGARMTCRSWTYRVRLAAGEVDADDPEGPVADPVVHEVVIDLSQPTARVAYLRDVTFFDTAVAFAGRIEPVETHIDTLPPDETEVGDEATEDDALDPAEDDDRGFGEWMFGDEEDTVGDEAPVTPTSPDESAAPATRRRIGRWAVP